MDRLLGGLRAWTLQRLSAMYLLIFLAVVGIRAWLAPPQDPLQWVDWWRPPWAAAAALLFFAALCLHAWVGARDVLLDYVKPRWLRGSLLTLLAVMLGLTALRPAVALFGLVR